jgi:hypothetical protein
MANPKLGQIVDSAREIFPDTNQRLITNGNISYDRIKAESAIDEIMLSCDGARQQSYGQYRVGGSIKKIFDFMRAVPRMKGGRRQHVIWKYILFEFNDSDQEILEAQAIAESLGIDSLVFVFTQTKYKSGRYTLRNSGSLPIVWGGARVKATPMHFQAAGHLIPVTSSGWPSQARDVLCMIDGVGTNGIGRLRLHGWAISNKSALERVRIIHNGAVVGTTLLAVDRPDVRKAHSAYARSTNPGFDMEWNVEGLSRGTHEFCVELLGADGGTIASFSREYLMVLGA